MVAQAMMKSPLAPDVPSTEDSVYVHWTSDSGMNPTRHDKSGKKKCEYAFPTNQHWCRTDPTALIFVDETQDVLFLFDNDSESDEAALDPGTSIAARHPRPRILEVSPKPTKSKRVVASSVNIPATAEDEPATTITSSSPPLSARRTRTPTEAEWNQPSQTTDHDGIQGGQQSPPESVQSPKKKACLDSFWNSVSDSNGTGGDHSSFPYSPLQLLASIAHSVEEIHGPPQLHGLGVAGQASAEGTELTAADLGLPPPSPGELLRIPGNESMPGPSTSPDHYDTVASAGGKTAAEPIFYSPPRGLSPGLGGAGHSNSDFTEGDSPLYRQVSAFPLQNALEGRLLRHFVEYLARWFDLCDPSRHFAHVVPLRAAFCSPLRNAVFAMSSKLLGRSGECGPLLSDQYYQKCISSLVPLLSDSTSLEDENLFAAVIILRNIEEVDAIPHGHPNDAHLFGSHVFVNAASEAACRSSNSNPGGRPATGLRRAALFIALRQEIYTACVSQRPVIPSFSGCGIDNSSFLMKALSSSCEPVEDDDSTYTNRLLLHLVDVLCYCFGPNDDNNKSVARYDDLVSRLENWNSRKPPSFLPFYENSEVGASTPAKKAGAKAPFFHEAWFVSDAVVTGTQHYHLARILLHACDPHAPKLGAARALYARRQADRIKEDVRILVGMAPSNSQCPPNYVTACMGVATAGDWFEEEWEQVELMSFLKKTEATFAWPTVNAQKHLAEAWGWEEHG
ncbi:uncharacterized protein MKZ38_005983 [Zalerion maritima]|uniref:Uncharacterized protein n=1 Tax=Zalerion maritima TaxID=339359 RepID=A0AAD5RK27_9PEZI|nr:uncharacterized protein MKZ38_005983 [Zalerion maritima]